MLLLLCAGAASAAEPAPAIVWHTDFDQALALARQSGRPLLLDFWATWCAPCKRMDREVWPDQRVAAMAGRYVFAAVEIDKERGLASRYLVRGVPTVIVADPWGHAADTIQGFADARRITSLMGELPADYSEVKDDFNRLERDTGNAAALHHVGNFYAWVHAFRLSNEYYEYALKTKLAKEDDALRETLSLDMAINQLNDNKLGDARKRLEACLKTFPGGQREADVLASLIAVDIRQGKRPAAEQRLLQLESRFPGSRAAAEGAALLRPAAKP